MALTVTTPSVGRVGPGLTLSVHSSTVGPIATTDIISVQVTPAGGGGNVCSGAVLSNGTHDFPVLMGVDNYVFASVFLSVGALLADGDSCDLVLVRYNSIGDPIESGSSIGWVYESTSALWNVMRGIVTHDPMLDTILANVRKTFAATH